MNENQIKKPIGIIGAMDEEVSLLKESASARLAETVAGMEFFTGELGDTPVVIVKCGIGKVNAGICTQILISRFQPAAIINTGVAGSLNADIDIGDIVVSTEAVQHDFNVSEIGVARGEIPPTGRVAFPADSSLCRMATEAVHQVSPEIHVFEGRICSGDQFISDRAQLAVATARPRSRMMKTMLVPIKAKSARLALREGQLISYVKRHNTRIFATLKANR